MPPNTRGDLELGRFDWPQHAGSKLRINSSVVCNYGGRCELAERSAITTHVYGAAGLIPGFVSIFYSVNSDATWREYVLVGSGWLAALFFSGLLFFAYRRTRDDGEVIGSLRARLANAEDVLTSRSATADYLAGLLIGKSATPRTPASTGE